MTDYVVTNTVSDIRVGPGDGVVAAAGASLVLQAGRSDENAGSGYSIQGNSEARLTSVRAENNGTWGLQESCRQSQVQLDGDNVLQNNGLGDRNCP